MDHATLTSALTATGTITARVAERLARTIIADPGMSPAELFFQLDRILNARYGHPEAAARLHALAPVAFASVAIVAHRYQISLHI